MAADFEGSNGPDNETGDYPKMYGFGGTDFLTSTYSPFARIYGGADTDYLYYTGGGKSEQFGGGGNDFLYGGDQWDKLIGGGGSDWFEGGLGKNIYKTGGGQDHIAFDAAPDNKLDKALDFNPSKDFLNFYAHLYPVGVAGSMLAKSQFRKGAEAKDEDDNFGYDKKTGIVWYDENGSDAGGHVDVIKLDKGLGMSHLNFGF
jgi:Ca2+-binding RTX toxin-like protein